MRLAFTAGVVCLAFSTQLCAEGYRFSTIDYPDSQWTELHGINAKGVIVGVYGDSEGANRAFRLRNGAFATLEIGELAGATFAGARGINARGDIVGNYGVDGDDNSYGFLISDGQFHRIRPPGAMITLVEEINNAGDITGSWFDQDFNRTHFIRRRRTYYTVEFPPDTNGVVRAAQDNGRVMVGWMFGHPDYGETGFIRHRNGEFEQVPHPGSPGCQGFRSINQAGDIVGSFAVLGPDEECYPPFSESHGILLRDGEFTYVDYPGVSSTEPTGINDDGVIIGRYTDAEGRVHGFKAVPRP